MGLLAFLNLEGPDIAAFFAATLLGYLAGTIVPAGSWSVYVSILVSYHLFLAWLVVSTEQKTGASLPIVSTILTHLACLTIVIPMGIGRHYVPFFSIFRYAIASLAIFERGWLFSGKSVFEPKREEAPTPVVVATSTAEDFQEWQRYLAQQKKGSRKFGSSLKTEYEQWLLARHPNRPAEPSVTRENH